MPAEPVQKGGDLRKDSPKGNGSARDFLLSEIVGKKVRTQKGVTIGRLKDFVFKDDPKFAEVTDLIVGRSFGHPSLKIPWSNVVEVSTKETVVQDAVDGKYPEVDPDEDLLLLRDKILDKRILDTEGFALEVVCDMQLLLVENKLFMVAVDVGRNALMRRLGFGRTKKVAFEHGQKEDFIPWKYVQQLGTDLTATKGDVKLTVAKNRLGDIHPEDVADILEELNREERIHVFNVLDSEAAANVLGAAEPRVQREILAGTSTERVAQIFAHLSPVEIAEIISILPRDDADEFQKILKGDIASKVHELLVRQDVPASILAVRRFLQFPGGLTVEDAFARFRKEAPSCIVTMYIYIVDDERRLKGVIDINELLQANPGSKLEDIMTRNVVTVAPATMRDGVEALFRRYRFRAIPVVDESRKLVGVLREKDVFSTGDEVRLTR